MISYDEALKLVVDSAFLTDVEVRPISQCAGRVLASDIRAPFAMPRFDNAAVDGYALGHPESSHPYRILGEVAAGSDYGRPLAASTSVRIFTGAPTPQETFAVVMQEDVQAEEQILTLADPPKSGANIRRKGEEFIEGELVLPKSTLLNAAGLAILASFGFEATSIHKEPRVAVLPTGAELVRPGRELVNGQIYESNSVALLASLAHLGIRANCSLPIGDTIDRTQDALEQAMEGSDVIITSGGVSVGDHDSVRSAALALGFREVFWRVAIKPGKPVFFAMHGKKALFGLPGNPMSALATYKLLVEPFIKRCMGFANPEPIFFQGRLTNDVKHKMGRREFMPAISSIQKGQVALTVIEGQGSHMLGGMARANCFLDFPCDRPSMEADEVVLFMPFGVSNL